MIKDSFDLERVKGFIEMFPDCNVVVIANRKSISEEYWNQIQLHMGIEKRAYFITNSPGSLDGAPIVDSLILNVGRWWENKNAREFMSLMPLAKLTLPITFIPLFKKGGDKNE